MTPTKRAVSKKPRPKKEIVTKYISAKVQMYHPFQKVVIPTGSPGVILEKDSWLECQIDRGLVKEM